MTDNELLLALSNILDKKLIPIENRLKRIEVDLLENNVLPRLNTIENCYMGAYKRYQDGADKMQSTYDDVSMMKKVVAEHSKKLQMIS